MSWKPARSFSFLHLPCSKFTSQISTLNCFLHVGCLNFKSVLHAFFFNGPEPICSFCSSLSTTRNISCQFYIPISSAWSFSDHSPSSILHLNEESYWPSFFNWYIDALTSSCSSSIWSRESTVQIWMLINNSCLDSSSIVLNCNS